MTGNAEGEKLLVLASRWNFGVCCDCVNDSIVEDLGKEVELANWEREG